MLPTLEVGGWKNTNIFQKQNRLFSVYLYLLFRYIFRYISRYIFWYLFSIFEVIKKFKVITIYFKIKIY